MNSSHVSQQIDILVKYFDRPERLYTGVFVKRFWREKILNQKIGFNNYSITSGRWSAFCHISQTQSFRNLVNRMMVDGGTNILCHPLLNSDLAQIMVDSYNLTTLDIDRNTLNWDTQKLQIFVRSQKAIKKPINLVIISTFNGLAEEIVDQIDVLNSLGIPIILVIENNILTPVLFNCLEKIKVGGVVYNYGGGVWESDLNQLLDTKKINMQTNWFLSFMIEAQAGNILDYNLLEKTDQWKKLIQTLLFIIRKKNNKNDWSELNSIVGNLLSGKVSLKTNSLYKDVDEAQTNLKSLYVSLNHLPISDLIFEYHLLENVSIDQEALLVKQVQKIEDLQELSVKWRKYFFAQVTERPQGSLEIPSYFLNRLYTNYFIYTTETSFWLNYLSNQGYNVRLSTPVYDGFLDRLNIKNALFVSNYLIVIKLD